MLKYNNCSLSCLRWLHRRVVYRVSCSRVHLKPQDLWSADTIPDWWRSIRTLFITPADMLTYNHLSYLFSHSSFPPFPLLCPCSPNETDQRQDYPLAGSLSTPHTPLHLPWETHLRCLATWRALCYCREKHSRARLTPHRITPFSLLPLWLSNQLNVFCVEHLRTWGRGCQPSTSCNHFGSALNLQLPEQIETEIHRLQVCAVINLRHFWLLKEKSCTWKGFR